MKYRIYKPILLIAFTVASFNSFAQDEKPIPVFTADSLATGNYKDVLTSFFQLAFRNLVGPNKELGFTTNPYAVMMRANPDLAVDTSYLKYTNLRNLNFAFNLKLDSNFKFNGFSSGINYAIINKRDHTVYSEFLQLAEANSAEYHKLSRGIGRKIAIARGQQDTVLAKKMLQQWGKLTNRDGKFTFADLDADVKAKFLDVANDSGLVEIQGLINSGERVNIFTRTQENYKKAEDVFKNRLLWTVSLSDTTYKNQFIFSNVVLSTQILQGFGNPKSIHGFEFDVKGAWNLLDDTLITKRDLKRSMLRLEGGFNYVLRSKRTDFSFFEFKLSAAYNQIFQGVYADERKEVFTLNGIFRVRILDDIWIPVEFRYDPDMGNVFGFISVKANFTALKKALNEKLGL